MTIIYLDKDFRCYVSNDDTKTAVETSFFDGKCNMFIEGYRYVPAGEEWVREDGAVFSGEMITPWKDYHELDAAQRMYEQQRLLEYETKEIELNNLYNEGINSI